MPITRSFGSNGQFQVTDWTPELLIVPNRFDAIERDGLFEDVGVTQNSITFEEITKDGGLVVDRVRGERNTVSTDASRRIRSLPIPHFPLDDFITPADVQGQRAYGDANAAETLAAARMRKLERIALSHQMTKAYARAQLLTTGNFYAPNGTVVGNIFTEFSVTQKSVNFQLASGTTNVIEKQEEAIAHIQDNAGGAVVAGFTIYASPEWFSAYIRQAGVQQAYSQYASMQEPLRNRVGGRDTYVREFIHGSVRIVEVRQSVAGQRLIPVNEAVMVPTGSNDIFKTYYAPAARFQFVNTAGEMMYVFEKEDGNDTGIMLQSETNFLNMCHRPGVIVKLTNT